VGLVRALIRYLGTQAAIWLAEANIQKLSHKALSHIERSEIRTSPMVVVELQYLFEIRRFILSPPESVYKLGTELQAIVCDYSFQLLPRPLLERHGPETR
jgi:uncharacterized membrane protein required for colicin V production